MRITITQQERNWEYEEVKKKYKVMQSPDWVANERQLERTLRLLKKSQQEVTTLLNYLADYNAVMSKLAQTYKRAAQKVNLQRPFASSVLSQLMERYGILLSRMGQAYDEVSNPKQSSLECERVRVHSSYESCVKRLQWHLQESHDVLATRSQECQQFNAAYVAAQSTRFASLAEYRHKQTDGFMRYVVSTQEKAAKLLSEAEIRVQRAQEELQHSVRTLNRSIDALNHSQGQSAQEGTATITNSWDILRTIMTCLLSPLNPSVIEASATAAHEAATLLQTSVEELLRRVDTKTPNTGMGTKTFQKQPSKDGPLCQSSARELGQDATPEAEPQQTLQTYKSLKEAYEHLYKTSQQDRELVRCSLDLFSEVSCAEKVAALALEELLKFRERSTALDLDLDLTPAYEHWLRFMEKWLTAQAVRHKKLAMFIDSNIRPPVEKLSSSAHADEAAWKTEMEMLCQDVGIPGEAVLQAQQAIAVQELALSRFRNDLTIAQVAPLASEKARALQIRLQEELGVHKSLLAQSTLGLRNALLQTAPRIREAITSYRQRDIGRILRVCTSFHGLLCYIQTSLEQGDKEREECLALLNNLEANRSGTMATVIQFQEIKRMLMQTEEKEEDSESEDDLVLSAGEEGWTPRSMACRHRDSRCSFVTVRDELPGELLPESPSCSKEGTSRVRPFANPMSNPKPSASRPEMHLAKSEAASAASPAPNSGESTSLAKRFGVKEQAVESFSCAISWKILLQGRLYITASRLCFYSPFNNATLFGADTRVVIPFSHILTIEKASIAVIFDNSIIVRTLNAEFFFTSFVYRNRAFNLIQDLVHKDHEARALSLAKVAPRIGHVPAFVTRNGQQHTRPLLVDIAKSTSTSQPTLMQQLEAIQEQRLKQAIGQGLTITQVEPQFDVKYQCAIQVIFPAMYVKPHRANNKLEEFGDNFDLVVDLRCEHPAYFTSYKEALGKKVFSDAETQERFLKTVAGWPIRQVGKLHNKHRVADRPPIPFFPDVATVQSEDVYYYVSPNYLIVDSKYYSQGIPYADYFVAHKQTHIRQTLVFNEAAPIMYTTTVRSSSFTEFLRSTILKSIIDNTNVGYTKHLLNDLIHPFLVEYTAAEQKRLEAIADRMQGSEVAGRLMQTYRPLLPRIIAARVLAKGLKASAYRLLTDHKILRNQHRLFYFGFCVLILAVLVLVFLSQLLRCGHSH